MSLPGFFRSRTVSLALTFGLLAWIGFKLASCVRAIGVAHLDFVVFWEAARAWTQNAPLYPPVQLSEHPPLLWLYPATAIYSVFWSAHLPLAEATLYWFTLKSIVVMIAVSGLIQRFQKTLPVFVILAISFLSWGRPVFLDLWNGNFVSIEWALLLGGTLLWSRERIASALVAIGFASSFKLLPIGYALSWFLAEKKLTPRKLLLYGGFPVILLAVLLIAFRGEAPEYVSLFRQIPEMDVLAWKNHDFSHQSFPYFFFRLTWDLLGIDTTIWKSLGWICSIGIVTLLFSYRRKLQDLPREWQAAVLWVAFSLTLPRNKDYNLIALIWPSLIWLEYAWCEIKKQSSYRREAWLGIALITLSAFGGQNREAQSLATFLFSQKRFLLEIGFAILLFRAALRNPIALKGEV